MKVMNKEMITIEFKMLKTVEEYINEFNRIRIYA